MILVATIVLLSAVEGMAQSYGYLRVRYEIGPSGDTLRIIDLPPVYCFKRKADLSKYNRLIYNVKKVYPIAREADRRLKEMEAHLLSLSSSKAQQAYLKEAEKELKKEYTPVLKNMTFSQGKVLIKLIDRETTRTSYALVKELRGNFTAFFWQGIARIFGANLKDTYDRDGEDKMIEHIILLYEAGMI